MVSLVFNNKEAIPKVLTLQVSIEAMPHIMTWYSPYHFGDKYTVTVDGRKISMDQNGEPTDL